MALFITKVIEASSSVEYIYLDSEHVWGKKLVGNYTFSILDTTYEDGSDVLLEGIDALQLAYARPNIAAKIAFDHYRNGNVTSISLPSSARVGSTTASITIEELIRVNDDNILSELFQNIASPQDVESFSESFSFNRGENSYNYNRSLSLKYKQDTASEFLNKSYLFAKNIFLGNRPNFGFLTDGISETARLDAGLKPLVSESYDVINKEFSFSESLDLSRVIESDGLKFSRNQTFSKNLDEQGYTEKRYRVEISALQDPLELVLNSGISASLTDLLSENTGEYGIPVSIEKALNSDGGRGSLNVTFSNDPRKNQQSNIVYSVTENQSQDAFSSYSFDMQVKTRGFNRRLAFENSKDYIKDNPTIGVDKVTSLFPEVNPSDLNEVSRSISYQPFERSASQNIQYTTNPAYLDNSDGILKRTVSISDTNQINRHEIAPIYGFREIGIENITGKTIGTRQVDVELISLNTDIENEAFLIASGYLPEYNYYYMDSKSSNSNPQENITSASINFLFFD